MARAVIIDDEINSRELLQAMLQGYCEGVEVLGMAHDVDSGIQLIKETEPNLVFLDVEMPGGDGFAVLDAFSKPSFQVVFVTGYQPNGFRAYALAALAWIQKPVDLVELQEVVQRSGLLPPTSPEQLSLARKGVEGDVEEAEELILPSGSGYERIEFEKVLYLEAHRSYAAFHLASGEERLASFPLSHYEKLFPRKTFFRIHKSYLVNARMVKSFEAGRGGSLCLVNGVELPIATRRKPDFLKFMKQFGNLG